MRSPAIQPLAAVEAVGLKSERDTLDSSAVGSLLTEDLIASFVNQSVDRKFAEASVADIVDRVGYHSSRCCCARNW